MTYRFTRIARTEIAEAVMFYEHADPGRGVMFESALKAKIDEIVAHSKQFPIAKDDLRYADMPPYPHVIYFRVQKQEVIIAGVYHQARDPAGLQGR